MSGRKGLTSELVVDAAVAIVDREGLPALTLSRVARELGVKTPSLYSHVAGLDDLRRLVALRAIGDLGDLMRTAAMGRSGRDALNSVAGAFRGYAAAHPGLYSLTVRARPDDEEYAEKSMHPVEPVLAILRSFGLHGDEAIHAARTLRSALHGFASLEMAGGFGLDTDVDASFAWLVDHLAELFSRTPAQ